MPKNIFIPASFFLLRSPFWSRQRAEEFLHETSKIDSLLEIYGRERIFQEAIAIASPSLSQTIEKIDSENLSTILFKYGVRMASRATPFGLFSFVGIGRWAEKPHAFINLEAIQKKVRPDMSWVFTLLQNLYEDVRILPSLFVKMNSLIEKVGERYVLSFIRTAEKQEKPQEDSFSVRASFLVQKILEGARTPQKISSLCEKAMDLGLNLNREKTQDLIQQLVQKQFLIPAILPSLLSDSPFEEILPQLPPNALLSEILEEIKVYEQTPLGEGKKSLHILQQKMQAMIPTKEVLQVDAVYKGPLTLSQSIKDEICEAAAFQWQMSPRKSKNSAIQLYHARFIEKYGTYRTVPLLELLNEQKGLGPFNPAEVAMKSEPISFKVQWDQWLHQQWQEALREGRKEILLKKDLPEYLYELAREPAPDPQDALVSMDVFFKVAASSSEDIERGDFLIQFTQPSWHGASAMGRFLYLLNKEDKDSLRDYFTQEERLEQNSLFVEASCWPQIGNLANVCSHPCLREHRLDLHDQTGRSLTLDDIYVGAYQDRFYLTLKEGGREIVFRVNNFLNSIFTPHSFQFMREVSLTKYQLYHPFSWGSLDKVAAFLPRIRFQKTILSPATWNFPSALRGEGKKEQFLAWAQRWGLPVRCFLVHMDHMLLIDLRNPASLKEIMLKIKKGEPLQFIEEIKQSWIKSKEGEHSGEFVLPLLKNPFLAKTAGLKPVPHSFVSHEERLKLLGDEWLCLKLYLQESLISRFLTDHIALLANEGFDFFSRLLY